MVRRNRSEDEGGSYNWMDTYGDLVTLLLTFFVLLFSFSTIDSQKWETLVGALSGSNTIAIPILNPASAMSRPIELIQTTTDEDIALEEDKAQQNYQNFMQLYANAMEYVETNELKVDITADYNAYSVTMRFQDNVLFDSGQAVILPEGQKTINHVINILDESSDFIEMVKIEGHTDNMPIHTTQFRDNWDLSAFRALNVLRYCLDSGRIPIDKVSAIGYGEYHPVKPNDTEDGRAYNRRVDFVIDSVQVKANN